MTPHTLEILIVLCASPFLILAVHIAVSRLTTVLKPETSRQLICIFSVILGHIPLAALLWFFIFKGSGMHGAASAIIFVIITYNTIGYCYFHLFNMSETGRRIRLLLEVESAGRLEKSKVRSLYDEDDILSVRLERLISMNQIRKEGSRYILSGRLLYVAARIVAFWGDIVGIPLVKNLAKHGRGEKV